MTDSKIISLNKPEQDPLSALLKQGDQQLLVQAIESEVSELLAKYSELQIDGKHALVRNGHLPERAVQTGLGDVEQKEKLNKTLISH